MCAPAAAAGTEWRPGEPHQAEQKNKDPRRNPEDFVGGDNQPLVGYLLRYPAGSLLLGHSHALQLIVHLLGVGVERRHRLGELRMVQRLTVGPHGGGDRGPDGAGQSSGKV